MHTFTVRTPTAPNLKSGESTFEFYFKPLFAELQDLSFLVDNWEPDQMHPEKQVILVRYRVSALNVGRRLLYVYRGKRFLSSFGFAIPANFGRVFAFSHPPDGETVRSCTYDGYHIEDRKLASQSVASFLAFEGTWTFATTTIRLVEVLRASLQESAALEETPRSLRELIGL